VTPLSILSIPVTHHGSLGTPGNLELRKRRSMASLAFNNVGLVGLMEDVDAGHARTWPEMVLFASAIFGEVSERT